jgi:hypothetical protein
MKNQNTNSYATRAILTNVVATAEAVVNRMSANSLTPSELGVVNSIVSMEISNQINTRKENEDA